MDKEKVAHTTEFFAAINKNEVTEFAGKWIPPNIFSHTQNLDLELHTCMCL